MFYVSISCDCKQRKALADPWHVLHEDREGLLIVVPQTAVVLNDALVVQILQELDFTL